MKKKMRTNLVFSPFFSYKNKKKLMKKQTMMSTGG